MRHHRDFVRPFFFRPESKVQEVRSGDLHFLHLIKVRPHISIQRVLSYCLTALVGFLRADDYSVNSSASDWKAMLLNKVVVGCGYKLAADNITLTRPPAGCDSVSIISREWVFELLTRGQVIGEVGGSLNFDELVVYNNNAILPSYLVMYDIPR